MRISDWSSDVCSSDIPVGCVVENAADASCLAAVVNEEVLVAPLLEARVEVGGVAVAGVLQGGVEVRRVLLDRIHRIEIGAAAEPRLGGDDVAGIHVYRRHQGRAQVRHQRDPAGPEPRVLLGAGDLPRELRRKAAEHRGDVHADLLEHAPAQRRHDAAAALAAASIGALPGLALEAAGRDLRSDEHTSELQSLMRISYAGFCLKKKKQQQYTPQ